MSIRSRRRKQLDLIAQKAETIARQRIEVLEVEYLEATVRAASEHATTLETTRETYDRALGEAGTVLFQQTDVDADTYYLSSSVSVVLGWQPTAFLTPGILRGMVHSEDLIKFDAALHEVPDVVSAESVDENPTAEILDELSVIDLTTGSEAPLVTDHGQPGSASDRGVAKESVESTIRFRTPDGTFKQLLLRLTGRTNGSVISGSVIDLTKHEAQRSTALRFAELVEHDPAGCLILEFLDEADPNSLVIRAVNPATRRLLNLENRDVDGLALDTTLAGSSAQLVRSALFDVYHTGESMTAERLSFAEIPGTFLDLRVDRLADGALGMTIEDVTSTVAVEERLRRQASHDALTALPNRSLFEERLAVAVDQVVAGRPIGLVLVDINGLRNINEAYGLHAGDELLVQIGKRLVQNIRGISLVSRFGDDEFAILTLPCSSDAEAIGCAATIRSTMSQPFDIAGHLINCATSIGIALAPHHGGDWRALLRNATTALKLDKAHRDDDSPGRTASQHDKFHESALQGKQRPEVDTGFTVFRRTEESSSIRRLAVLSELRQSLANNDLELRFQPQIDLRTGRVTKVEAVPRWLDDDDPSRMSVELLELAEQSGLIQPLTRWTLTETARAATALENQNDVNPFGSREPIIIAANLSVQNLFDPDLITFIEMLVRSGELRPDLVELEVSETGLMDDPGTSLEVLARLSAIGMRFVVDDFGTGYTSFSTMQHLPVVGLKVDRGFVSTIATVPSDAAIVRSTVELSHELGLSVAAEGVADAETLALLSDFGCDFAQGYYLSDPVRLDQLPGRIDALESAVRGGVSPVNPQR